MSDASSPSGVMLRRAFMLLIGCCGAAYILPRNLGDTASTDASTKPPTPQSPAPRAQNNPDPFVTETFHAQQGNQFYVPGSVNGNPIHFLVDTGATRVALTPDDAKLLGFNLATLNWDTPANTANGMTSNASVTLGSVRLGRVVEYNVPAIIMRQGNISLLGMSFLSRLSSWQISNGVLTIAS